MFTILIIAFFAGLLKAEVKFWRLIGWLMPAYFIGGLLGGLPILGLAYFGIEVSETFDYLAMGIGAIIVYIWGIRFGPPSKVGWRKGDIVINQPQLKGSIHKKCKFCAELILFEAIVCKHCGRDQPTHDTIT